MYEVLENREFKLLWVRTRSFGRSPAYIVCGRTEEGRYLVIPGVAFEDPPMKDVFMPVTARPMTSKEKTYYEELREGGSHEED
ncbi:MAG: hypothetical protein H5T71_11605 [Chloroflexi bacterium]|nr:hypothetical protein [Chloroflexota bacterium]